MLSGSGRHSTHGKPDKQDKGRTVENLHAITSLGQTQVIINSWTHMAYILYHAPASVFLHPRFPSAIVQLLHDLQDVRGVSPYLILDLALPEAVECF